MKHELNADFVQFTHACFGYPAVSTLLHAARRGWLTTFPRITAHMISTNPPNQLATAKGHLDRTRRNLQTTQPSVPPTTLPPPSTITTDSDDTDSDMPFVEDEYHNIYVKIIATQEISHADITGRFPTISRRGNQYMLLSVWNNYIHIELMKSRSASEYVRAYAATIDFYASLGHKVNVMRIDNETSHELDAYLASAVEKVQFVPPNNHRANRAERGWRTAKNHMIATLSGTDPLFPLASWDEFLPQIKITLNTLRPFAADATISAYQGAHGHSFDFNLHPIAPFGTKVLIYESPDTRTSWGPHGVAGFYLGPALQHHRTFRVHCTQTRAERISDSLAWFPTTFKMPGSSTAELLLAQLADLDKTLRLLVNSPHIPPAARQPFLVATSAATEALTTIASNFSPFAPVLADPGREQRVPPTMPAPTRGPPARKWSGIPFTTAPALVIIPTATPTPIVPPPTMLATTIPPLLPFVNDPDETPAEQRVLMTPRSRQEPPVGVRSSLRLGIYRSRIANVMRSRKATHPNAEPAHIRLQRPAKPTNPVPPTPYDRSDYSNPWLAGATPPPITAYAHSLTGIVPDGERPLNLSADGSPLTLATALAGPDAAEWDQANVDEFDRLLGSTQTMRAIKNSEQPEERRRDTTYYNPQIKEKMGDDGKRTFRVRGTAGGDRINYPGDVSSTCADMPVVKTLLQSVVSDDAHWITADIKDYYLMTPLERPEYIRIPVKMIPPSIITKYNLHSYIHHDKILFEVNKGMYGLPQAGLLAQQRLIAHLATAGYHEAPDVPCLFRHATNSVAFALVVDDFGIKYTDKADVDHLIATIRELYELKVDWTGKQYLGLTIMFDSAAHTVTLSMPGYITKVITRFRPNMTRGAQSPAIYTPPSYGSRLPQTISVDNSPPLDAAAILELQQITGCMLYYARAVDYTMLPAVTAISSDQAHATAATLEDVDRLLAYAVSYPDNQLVLTACDMVLHMQSDGSHLSRSRSRGVAGGIAYFGNAGEPTHINGAIHVHSCILDVVVASVAECEYASLYMLARIGVWLRTIACALGYPQPPTTIFCDNACAVGIANGTVKLHRTKSIDMRFHWIRDRVRQRQFVVEWRQGAHNLADFFTKPLPVHVHQALMQFLIHTPPGASTTYSRPHAMRGAQRKAAQTRNKQMLD